MKAKELWKQLGDPFFLMISCNKFIEDRILKFKTQERAEEFLTTFLLNECISGSNSEKDLMRAYEIIQKWVSNGEPISSEDLPIGRHKTHAQKSMCNVGYFIYRGYVFAVPLPIAT